MTDGNVHDDPRVMEMCKRAMLGGPVGLRSGETITVIAPRAVQRAELERENNVACEEERLP